ncbi:putative Aspartyl/glutamyl-tRNA(Asn/Gln) amidotransferase subunit B [Nannochloris sp. 'desiccata']|nr:putative Aspartyl/glutamyl-tRNA(Asn/Gln) amidotransferase subunit B [Chlorella desiccata (nom. nud.)]
MIQDGKVPVTVVTGFLGSGKTTFINYILTANHGKKIAVIENEFGEVGVDDALVIESKEEIFEMNNGCICCTVRGDLIRILHKLVRRKNQLDAIIIETTGLADPAPVAQTFFVDDDVKESTRLDAILTVVDCKHLLAHLNEEKPEGVENEAVEQIAFADRVLLNKIDLVSAEEKADVIRRIKEINGAVEILETTHAKVDLSQVLGIKAFDLQRILESEPEFLDPDQEHEHDSSVSSVGIEVEGQCDFKKLNTWLSALLQEKGADIFRSKGVLCVDGSDERFVFQGVHMLLSFGNSSEGIGRPWGKDEKKVNRKAAAYRATSTAEAPVDRVVDGALPVLNEEMVKKAVLAGLALDCTIAKESKFDRKQYFYADLPKGYQISQYDVPICEHGRIEVVLPEGGGTKQIGITRAHLEEDAGKLVYSGATSLSGSNYSLVDYNRGGVPLLEIVSEPDMRTGKEAAAYGAELRRIMRFLGVSDGNMSEGSMRCDVNISVRPRDQEQFGTKVEIKNMNSFNAMQRAIEFEFDRQLALLKEGRASEIVQETRLWDENKQVTKSMRKKEGLADYRYFPEPDLPALFVSTEAIEDLRNSMPELPSQKRARYMALGLSEYDALVLTDDVDVAAYYDEVLKAGGAPKLSANWVMGDIMASCKEEGNGMDALKMSPKTLVEMISLIEKGTISGKIAKDLLPALLKGDAEKDGVQALVESRGLIQISDPAALQAIVDSVLDANPKQLGEYRGGKTKLQGFFVGQVMKESKGRANPGELNRILMETLNKGM